MNLKLLDLTGPSEPERAHYIRGFVEALLLADVCGYSGLVEVVRRRRISIADMRAAGLSHQEVGRVLDLLDAAPAPRDFGEAFDPLEPGREPAAGPSE